MDVEPSLVELEAGDAFVCEAKNSGVGAQPETNIVGADGEAVEFNGDKRGGGGGGAKFGFADFEVVIRFYAKLVGKEGGVINCVAGLDDEVFEEEVDFRGGDFDAWDGYILDCLN